MEKSDLKKLIKTYPPPRESKEFVMRWSTFLPKVVSRENFSEAHLLQLEVLCDLFCEYYNLRAVLEVTGYTYENDQGRAGRIFKNYPEVGQMNVCRSHILTYSKMLGLVLAKDLTQAEEKEIEDSWT